MRILHISCGYFLDSIGGTEVYVHNLSQELIRNGYQPFVSYIAEFYKRDGPKFRTREYDFEGIPVFVIERNLFNLKTQEIYFGTSKELSFLFKDYLRRIQPDIIHFHHFSPIGVITQLEVAKELRLSTILTYHTPMMTCSNSVMLFLGKSICTGKLDFNRCLMCLQVFHGVPLILAWTWAKLPKILAKNLGKLVVKIGVGSRLATWLQLPWINRKRIESWRLGLQMIDHFVVVCQWAYGLLLENNISREKISLCRQGIGQIPPVTQKQRNDTLRLGFLGRIHQTKGLHILLQAFKSLSGHYKNIELSIYGSVQKPSDEKYYYKLRRQSRKDKRIKWLGVLSGKDKFQALNNLDILIIPSYWLETGPLVLLEAWAVETPVIGSRLGGISELVTEGKGGLLFEAGNPRELARLIKKIYNDPQVINRLRESIPAVRTMKDVASDMDNLYQRIYNKIR